MLISKVRAFINLVEGSNIEELRVSSFGRKITIKKKIKEKTYNANPLGSKNPRLNSSSQLETIVENKKNREKHNLIEITSQMVGTFYSTPAPDAKPYVEVGKQVQKGQIIYRIETMKLTNEIASEYTGKIFEVLVQNAKPVEYGQPLFLIDTTAKKEDT